MTLEYGINVSLTNEDNDNVFSEWSEPLGPEFLKDDGTPDMGEIYRYAREEYGRCTSSVYVDTESGRPVKVGWFFVSRQQYTDTHEPYLRGAWVRVGSREIE